MHHVYGGLELAGTETCRVNYFVLESRIMNAQHKQAIVYLISGGISAAALCFLIMIGKNTDIWMLKVVGLLVVILSSWSAFSWGQDAGAFVRVGRRDIGLYRSMPFALGFTLSVVVFAVLAAFPKLFFLWCATIGLSAYGYFLGRSGFDFWSVKLTRRI